MLERMSSSKLLQGYDWRQYIVYIAFVVVFVFFSITLYDVGFLSTINLFNIIRQTAVISIMAVGMTFVISAAEIDLSVGSVAALSSLTAALAMNSNFGLAGAIVAGLGTGALLGFVNGMLVTKVAIPSFLVTLGMLAVARGLAMWITNTEAVPIFSDTYNFIFGGGEIGPIPMLFFWTAVIVAIGHFLYRKTAFGRRTLATGGNESAARFSGVNTARIKLLVLVGSGTMAGLAGMLYAGRLQAGRFSIGEGDELSVIAAVILGGTALFGGVGTVIGALIGSLLIGLINNGLVLMNLDVSQQMVIRGAIIILAVALGRRSTS